ncbi:hypothetical protein ACPOL_4970 [Acidisarcina polymorpha]|uniref:Uncharacterized protein n=1 Tax=Acidisarcina polymorpha TaxID=2211140 RepID=A0A2Z5G4Z9_9BACT|nr:hypothetical protein ACPOL_4970 [Acidisarcina polymorpha]
MCEIPVIAGLLCCANAVETAMSKQNVKRETCFHDILTVIFTRCSSCF